MSNFIVLKITTGLGGERVQLHCGAENCRKGAVVSMGEWGRWVSCGAIFCNRSLHLRFILIIDYSIYFNCGHYCF